MEKIEELFNQVYLLKLDLNELRTLVSSLDDGAQMTDILSRISTLETSASSIASSITALTSLVNSHTTTLSELSSLSSTVAQNTSDINSNSQAISSMTQTLSSLSSTVSQNSEDIETNAQNISATATSLSSLRSVVASYDERITTNRLGVEGLSSRVTALETASQTADSSINSLFGLVTGLLSSVASIENRLSSAESGVSTNASDISSLDTRVTTAEGDIQDNASDIATANGALSTLQEDVTALENKTQYVSAKNFVVNPAFHVNTAGHTSYSTTGTEIVYVDNWRMGTSNGQVTYTYEGNHVIGAGGYIKQNFELDRIKAFCGKTCLLTICTSGVISSGVNLVAKTVAGSNNTVTTKTADISGRGSNRLTSMTVPVTLLCKALEISIENTSNSSATCNIKWLKLEMGTNYTTFLTPVDREEKYACCESG